MDLNRFIVMAANSTINDVLVDLRRLHHIGKCKRVEYHVLFPKYQFASLALAATFRDVGIGDLSVLHIRTSVLGGGPNTSKRTGTFVRFQLTSLNLTEDHSSIEGSSTSGSKFSHRTTNSPLVSILPWSVEGIADEEWRDWANNIPEDMMIPPGMEFGVRYSAYSNEILTRFSETHQGNCKDHK